MQKKGLVRISLCIALVSFCVLFLQIAATRILSVVLWYHWAFLAVSLAMLGIGAPGVWFALRAPGASLLPRLLLASSALIPLSIAAVVRFSHHFGDQRALFCMVSLLLPMLALGACVCLLLIEARGSRISTVYGFDLLGACSAAVLVIPAMYALPTPSLAAGLGFLPLVAHRVWSAERSPARVVIFAALFAALVWQVPFQVRFSKKYDESGMRVLYERWTPTARLTVFDGIFWRSDRRQAFAWGMGTELPKVEIPQLWLEQDGSAGTPITRFAGDFDSLSFLLYDVTSLGYQVASPRRVAIIGAGGGRDILSALLSGADDVDAVEINPGIVEALSGPFRDFAGDVYRLDKVTPVVSEGRSFLQGSAGDYDLIQIALTDSWAATAAGAFALSENNLYTVESYRLYWSRLSGDGIVSTSRYVRGPFGIEIPRLVVLLKEVLRSVGVADPNAHLVIATGGKVGTVLMFRRPVSPETRAQVHRVARERGFTVLHPSASKAGRGDLLGRILRDGRSAIAKLGVDLSPPTDDRPFFFHVLPVFSLTDVPQNLGVNGRAVGALRGLMVAMFALTALLFFLPFFLAGRLRRAAGFWRGSAYFACIGLGFMLIELPWLQRFILPLGHPSHATTVVLASLLLGAGLGSLLSAKIGVKGLQRFGLAVPLLVGVVNLALPGLFEAALGWSYPPRVALSVALVAPVGLPLGMFFPLGMLRFGDADKAWYWAINGACGVFSGVLSLALAMEFGLSAVTWVGVVAYAAACLLIGGHADESPVSS